jgi:hypothetical protein
MDEETYERVERLAHRINAVQRHLRSKRSEMAEDMVELRPQHVWTVLVAVARTEDVKFGFDRLVEMRG